MFFNLQNYSKIEPNPNHATIVQVKIASTSHLHDVVEEHEQHTAERDTHSIAHANKAAAQLTTDACVHCVSHFPIDFD